MDTDCWARWKGAVQASICEGRWRLGDREIPHLAGSRGYRTIGLCASWYPRRRRESGAVRRTIACLVGQARRGDIARGVCAGTSGLGAATPESAIHLEE